MPLEVPNSAASASDASGTGTPVAGSVAPKLQPQRSSSAPKRP
jgi:hypothetical protein